MKTLGLTLIPIATFILGYYFCKVRYRVNDLLRLIDLYAKFIKGDLTLDEFRKYTKRDWLD